MNTNAIAGYTQVASEVVQSVKSLGPELFTVLVCLVLGYAIKFIPRVNNNWIPPILVLVVAPAFYCAVSEPDLESFIHMRYPIIRQIGLGICCGFAAWAIHRAFLRSWLDRRLFNGDTDNKQITDSGSH